MLTPVEKLRRKGLKLTPQRMLIYDILYQSTRHPTADEIYRVAKRRYPGLSLNTVYKTLESLIAVGEVVAVETPNSRAHYEITKAPHHHFLCRGCGSIEDVPDSTLGKISIPRGLSKEYDVTGFGIMLYGYCPNCRAKRQTKGGG